MDQGETTVMATRLWWRALVGGKLGGAIRSAGGCGFLKFGRNPSRFDTDNVMPAGVSILPEGCQDTSSRPLSIPGETLGHTGGNPRYCPGSSVVAVAPFFEVLLGTRRFGMLGEWW